MARYKVTYQPADVTVEVDPDDPPRGHEGEPGSLMDVGVTGGVEFSHGCAGAGVCGLCHVIVEEGMENLSEADDDELDTIECQPNNTPRSRLACQAIVKGDVTVRFPG